MEVVIIFLAVFMTVYPLKKIDDYIFRNKIKEPKNRVINFLIKTLSVVFVLGWFVFSCYIAVKIYKILENLISSSF